jgi:hypothetical protein
VPNYTIPKNLPAAPEGMEFFFEDDAVGLKLIGTDENDPEGHVFVIGFKNDWDSEPKKYRAILDVIDKILVQGQGFQVGCDQGVQGFQGMTGLQGVQGMTGSLFNVQGVQGSDNQ